MRKVLWVGVAVTVATLAVEVTAQQAPKSAPAPTTAAAANPAASKPATPTPGSGIRFVASVRDVMHILVEPNADKIFESVAIDVNESGIHEHKPQTEEEWDEIEHSAIAIAEAVNLIKMVGRPMAQPGELNDDPEGPELPPAQIAAHVNRTRTQWNKYANALQDIALKTLTVVKKKDTAALFDIGGDLDMACENCHLEYWYPDEKKRK
jgi:hypothetical protein